MDKLIVILFEAVCMVCCLTMNDSERKFAIKIKENGNNFIFKALEGHRFRRLNKVIQETYIFEYQGKGNTSELSELIQRLKIKYKNTIVSIERVIVYDGNLKPGGISTNLAQYQIYSGPCHENYYGMGVRKAWSLGYTGNGVTIAVTDVGIHTDLLDLKDNIEDDFSYNFITNSKNVTPEFFHNLQAESAVFTDHGNNCASIIASAYGNGICSSGIAYNAAVVGLKVYMVNLFKDVEFHIVPKYSSRSDIIARALAYNHTIDIYSNAWAPTDPFICLDTLTKDVIKHGAEKGRQGLGIIYVFPAGPPGNGFANSIYTIAVNGVGRYGGIHKDSTLSASVITSGLADGSNITASYMLTSSRNNRCVTNFKGVSPATAQVAAIIALAFEANPNLTLRDIQHLLVQASEPVGKPGENNFKLNGAGRYFHNVFGYGLLNAEKLVKLAANRQPIASLLTGEENPVDIRNKALHGSCVVICKTCFVFDSYGATEVTFDTFFKVQMVISGCRVTVSAGPRLQASVPAKNSYPLAGYSDFHLQPVYPTLFTQEVEFCYSCAINDSSKCVSKLEHVTVNISFQSACGKLQIVLVSPNGTESVLVKLTDVPKQNKYTTHLVSVQFWDEAAFGNYLLKISDGSSKCGRTNVLKVSLILHGTHTHNQKVKQRQCREIKEHTKNNKCEQNDVEEAVAYIGGIVIIISVLAVFAYRANASRTCIKNIYEIVKRCVRRRSHLSEEHELQSQTRENS